MGSGKYFVSVPIKFDVDDELEELRKKLEKVVSDASSEMTGELGDGFKSLESNIKDIKKAIDALGKTQAGSSEYEKAIKSLQTQFDELSKRIDDINIKIKSFSSSGATAGEIDNVSNSLDSLNKSIKDTANSVSSLNNSSGSFKTNLKDNLEETKKEAKETAAAMKEVADGVKVYKNQINSTTTNKKGKKQQALSWTEFTDFFQTVTKNATVKPDGTLNIISEKVRTNYEALEKEITKVDKKIIDLMFDMGKQGNETSASTGKQIDLLREYLALLERTRNKQISSPEYLADQGHAQTIDFVRGKVQVTEYNSEITKVAKTIDSLREKIANVDKAGISSDYAQDLDNADKSLENLAQDLQDFFNQIKANNGQISDVEFFKFFNNYKKVMSSVDDTLGFAKVDKQIAKLKNDLIEINTAIASSGKNTDVSALERKRDELEKTVNALVSARNAELQLTGASANSYDNATASIAKYNEEIISATESLSKMREKISSLMADESRSAAFKSELSNLSNDIRLAGKELDDAFILLKQNPFDTNNLNSFRIALAKVTETTEQYNKLVANSTTSKAYAATREDVQKLDNQISAFLDQNTAAANRFKQELLAIQAALRGSLANGVDMSKFDLSTYSEQVNRIQSEVKSLHQTGNSFFTSLKKQLQSANAQFIGTYLSIQDFIRYGKEIFDTVKNINSALTELRKVSDATTERLVENFETSAKTAKELGDSVKDVINMTADWARLGYDVDAAEELARVTTLFKNVGDDMSAETASEYMISALQGFQIAAEDAERIVDAYNEVANNYAIDTAGIGEALERSAASFNAANTSMEKAIALVTATNEVVQNPESVGTLWKTMSARIRGAKTELEELGEEEDQFTQTTSKLRDLVMGLTGFDILEEDGETFKDIYEIILGIGKEWDKLTDIEQASLGEALAGKRNANAFYAVIGNLETLQEAYETASNSAGSAAKEQENFAKSIQYSLNKLEASFEVLAADLLDSQFAKGLVEFLTSIVNFLDAIVENVGVLIPLLTTLGGLSIIKNLDNIRGLIDLGKSLTAIEEATKLLDPLLAAGAATDVLANSLKGLTIEQSANLLASKGLTKAKIEEILVSQGADIEIAKETALRATLTNTTVTQTKSTISLSAAYKGLASSIGLSTTALTALLGVFVAVAAVAFSAYEVAKAEREIAEAAQEVGQKFSDTKKDIEDYKEEVDELRDVLNNSTDLDELRSARERLLEIQNQMIDAYGTEAGEVIDLTNTINDQTEAWEKLTEAQWQATKNSFNADKKWNLFDDAARWLNGASDNIDVMLTEVENTAHLIEFAKADKALLESLSQKYDLSYSGNTLIVKGNLYDIQKTVLDIQNTLEKTDGVSNSTIESVRDEANEISKIISNYGDLYKQYVYYERILKNDSYKEKFNAVQEAYADYQEALLNADEQAQKAALKRIVEAKESLESEMKSGGLNAEEQSVLNFIDDLVVQVQDKLDSVEFEVNITANTNDLFTHIEEAISEFDNPGSIPDVMLPFGDESYTKEQIEAWQYLSAVAKDYGLTVSELVETLAKLGKIKVDFNYEVPKKLRDEVGRAYGKLQSQMYVGQVEIQEPPISHSDLQDAKEYSETLYDIYKQYNGINNMDRDFIYWDDETLEKYRDFVTEQYGTFEEGAKALKDTWSTVMGGVEDEGEIKIAFSQLLQTDHGLVPLTEDALWEYIDGIYSKAIDENGVFDVEKFIQLDKEGTQMVINGQVENVANMIAAAEGQYLNGIKLTADDVIAIGTPKEALPDDFGESIFKGFSLHEIQEKTLLGSLNDYLMSLEKETLPTLDELFEELKIDTADEYEAVLAIISGCEDWREAVKRVREAFAEVNDTTEDFNFNSLTDAVNDVNKKLLPQFRELGELYDEIFNGDNGFDLSGIGADELFEISEAFSNLDAALGIEPPTDAVNEFLHVIGNSSSTIDQVENSFDALATAYFNAAVNAGNFSEENAAVMEQMLKEMGIVNADEVVEYYQTLAEAQKLAADNGKDLADMTAAEIEQFAQEVGASEETANALYILALKKIFLNENWVNEETSVEQVLALAKAAGIAAEAVTKLANVQAQISGIKANIANEFKSGNPNTTNISAWEAQLAGLEQSAADYAKQIEEDINNVTVDIEFSVPKTGSGGSSASEAGKDAADEYVEAFEKELEALEKQRDAGIISEKEFLEKYKNLIERYFKDVDGYAEEYASRMHDYFDRLTSYYESVFSAIGTILSHRISALESAKSAAVASINAEKEAAAASYQAQIDYIDGLIDAKEAEIDAIDKEIDRYQDQIDAIDKQIDKLQEEHDKRKQNLDLMKAQYDLERAQNQRTKLVYKGGQLVYENDTSAVREAKENLEDAEFEIQKQKLEDLKKPLEEQIELLEKRKELIQDEIDGLQKQQEAIQKAMEASNKYYEQMIKETEAYWDALIEKLEKTKTKYEELVEMKELANAFDLINKYLEGTGYTLEDVLNDVPGVFEMFLADYEKALLAANANNEGFAESLALAEQEMKDSFGNIAKSADDTKTALDPLAEALSPLTQAAVEIGDTADALGKVADNSEKVATNTGDAATNTDDLNSSLDEISSVSPKAAEGLTETASSMEHEADAAESAGPNVERVASGTQKVSDSSSTAATNVANVASALEDEATNADNAYKALENISNVNLDTINSQLQTLASSIQGVTTALGLTADNPISALEEAITRLSTMSLGEESSGIIGSFNSLKTAVEGVTSAIGSGGGASTGGDETTNSKSPSMSEGANDGGSGGLIGAIGELHTAADENIGTSAEEEGSEEGGTVISDFNALKAAVDKVSETIGLAGENGEAPEGSLLGIIQTMPDVAEEPISKVKEFFNELCGAISSCVDAVGELLAGIDSLGGMGFSISKEATGNVHIGEATGNVHAGNVHSGNAYASGKLGIKKSENALVGEIGRELVYNPATGTYRTVGDHGPEITRLNKGDLIFNAEQTKAIIKHGKRDHGHSYAGGNSEFMPLTSAEIEMFKKMGSAVEGIKADVDQMLEPVKSLTRGATYNTTNNNPVINISDTHFDIQGVTGEQVARQISDTFEGMISHAYQRAMKK